MKKSLKKAFAWIMAVCVTVTLQGCGSRESEVVLATVEAAESGYLNAVETEQTDAAEAEATEAEEGEKVSETTDPTGEETCDHEWREYHQLTDGNLDYANRRCIHCNAWEVLKDFVCQHPLTAMKRVDEDYIYEWDYCEICGDETNARQTPNSCAHRWTEKTEMKADEVNTYKTCSGCGALVLKHTEANTCAHVWEIIPETRDGVVVNATRSCGVCGAIDERYAYQHHCNHQWEARTWYNADGSVSSVVEYCVKCGEPGEVVWFEGCKHVWGEVYREYYQGVLVLEVRDCINCAEMEVILDLRDTISHEHIWTEYEYIGDGMFYCMEVCEICGAEGAVKAVECGHDWEYHTEYCGSEIVLSNKVCRLCWTEEKYVNPGVHQWHEEYVYDSTGEILLYVVTVCGICGRER